MDKSKEYTFFPDPSEYKYFSEIDSAGLASLIQHQPDMTGRIAHELLRQDRRQVLYEAFTQLAKPEEIVGVTAIDMITSFAMARSFHNMEESNARRYVTETLSVVTRAVNRIPLDEELESELKSSVNRASDLIMERVHSDSSRFRN